MRERCGLTCPLPSCATCSNRPAIQRTPSDKRHLTTNLHRTNPMKTAWRATARPSKTSLRKVPSWSLVGPRRCASSLSVRGPGKTLKVHPETSKGSGMEKKTKKRPKRIRSRVRSIRTKVETPATTTTSPVAPRKISPNALAVRCK